LLIIIFNYNLIGHVITGDLAIVTNDKYVILFIKVLNTVNLNTLTEIRFSKYLWIPLRIMPGSGQNRRRWNLTHSLTFRSLIRKSIFKLSRSMSSKVRSIFNDIGLAGNLTHLQNKYVVIPADKADKTR